MKKIGSILLLSFMTVVAFAQQEQQYTQFIYNKLSLNPGYAGSHDSPCLTGFYRNQWMGLEGAPKTMGLSFDMPMLNKRIGVGMNLARNTIGITERWTLDGVYAYRIPLGHGTMSIGVQGSIRYHGNDYSDSRLTSTQPISIDGSIPTGEQKKYLPNFGAGLYYSSDKFYFGFSVPRVLLNNIDFNSIDGVVRSKEAVHLYGMVGLIMKMNERVKFQPQLLLKYADNSPFDFELNTSFIFNDMYTAGLTYRAGGGKDSFGESLDLLLSARFTPQFLFGLSYDITLSDLKTYNSGSIEAVLRYCFGSAEGEDIVNPRFF
ncbi:MAG TPA: type IX secretion system membrane protein PorP/SprF [Phaeodactylibacter sp.]|nr:type IX secretion system membrane protein PorP/SprF [Phaeodactylibacter sp.]